MCEACGFERRWKVRDCKLCEVLARNVALEKEVKEIRGLLGETRQQMQEFRGEFSVRSRMRIASDESLWGQEEDRWRVVDRRGKGKVSTSLCEGKFPPLCEVECSNKFERGRGSDRIEVDAWDRDK